MRPWMILLIAAIVFAGAMFGSPITWTLQNAVFDDGGTASGFFVYDRNTFTVSNWDISTAGGNTSIFFPFEFTPANSFVVGGPGSQFPEFGSKQMFPDPSILQLETLYIDIGPVSSLTNAGGTFSIIGFECFNCGTVRNLISGSLTSGSTVVPEPGGLSLSMLGLLLSLGYLRYRNRRASVSSLRRSI